MSGERILVVDDEPAIVDSLTYSLRREGYEVDVENQVVRGPLVASGQETGIELEVRTGGPAIENGFADPDKVFNPTDVRAAALLAAGIDPFANGVFGGADVSRPLVASGDNVATARNIVNRFFG